MERLWLGCEVRAERRRLSGIVMRYGEISPSHRERFEPGSLRPAETVHLDLHHDPERVFAWQPGGGLTLTDGATALSMVANLPKIPAAERALIEVRSGQAAGLSIEFRAQKERRGAGGLRIIESAVLNGIGLVRSPSYKQSQVEVRARSGRTLRGSIPYDRDLACECIAQRGPGSGGSCVPVVQFGQLAGESMAQAVRDAMQDLTGKDVLAVYKDYSRPIGSARKGTLRAVDGPDGLAVEVDLPTGEAGDMAVAASEVAGLIVRPLIDYDADGSKFTDTPEGRIVEKAAIRAFLIGSTDARQGWPDARIDYAPEGERSERRAAPERRRRVYL